MSLGTSLPIYVTRKTSSGLIAEYSLSIWMTLLAIMVIWANIVGWGCFGLYVLARLVIL